MGLKITNANGELPELWLYADIGEAIGGISADEFRKALQTIPDSKPINLRINSDGGVFTESIAIYTNLRNRKGAVNVFVDGLAASGASVVAMAGKTVTMARGAWLMIHEARASGNGRAEEMRRTADMLDAMNKQLISIYSDRWNGSEEELVSALTAETWFTEDRSVEVGLADSVAEIMAAAAHVDPDKFGYKSAPKVLVEGHFPRLKKCEAEYEKLNLEKTEPCDAN